MHLAACSLVVVVLGALLDGCRASGQERSTGVRRVVYVLEVDVERACALEWAPESASEAEVVASAERIVRRRLAAMERSFQLQTELERQRIELSMPQIQPRDRELFAEMLASLGRCEFLFVADDVLASALGIGLAAERAKLEAWLAANPDAPVEVFNALDPAHEGPHAGLLWAATSFAGAAGPPQALLLPTQPEDHVGSGSFERTYLAQDAFGYPAIGFALQPERADDFARLTTAHVHHRLGIVLEGKLRSTPMLEASLIGGGVIEGRFTDEEVARLTESMEQHRGPLRVVEIR